ncbi:hypothetical protein PHMEG_00012525 [Phytophthora megakarya]|uniref:Peptidase A2 domain-containing protein n=1 Tax=Phytophthora megakarya TaxID=4795 RepID=A0A225W8Z3_9STRA|nr:hypothetical protein PHMEG_00012525 [Phytophthora megakarya]
MIGESVLAEPTSSEYCAFAYVGPALLCRRSNNLQSMFPLDEERVLSISSDAEYLRSAENSENLFLEFTLQPGEKFGWWNEHALVEKSRKMAIVHGAKFNTRVQVLLDSGTTTCIISFDHARRLKLSLNHKDKLRILGYDNIPTYISAKSRIKLTLGPRVVYVLDVWVRNIGAGVDCLLGMDFMMSTGVRLCVREGVVKLPDEESSLLDGGPEFDHLVWVKDTTWLRPGEHLVVPIQYGRANPEFLEFSAGRGEKCVTRFIYGVNPRLKAVEEANVSNSIATVYRNTVVAHVMGKGYLHNGERFCSQKTRKKEKLWKEFESMPSVKRTAYSWPKKR